MIRISLQKAIREIRKNYLIKLYKECRQQKDWKE